MIKKLIALSLLMAFNASAGKIQATKVQADTVCNYIESLASRYSIYGSLGMKSILPKIAADKTIPKELRTILTLSYYKAESNRIGNSHINPKGLAKISEDARIECMAYFDY